MEFVNHSLATSLNKLEDCEASVACSTMPEVPKNFEYSYYCSRSKSLSILTPLLEQKNIANLIRTKSLNLLHGSMLHDGGFEAMKASSKFGIPFVAHAHGADIQNVPQIGYGALQNPLEKAKLNDVLRGAHKLIAPSSLAKEYLVELGAQPESVALWYSGTPVDVVDKIPFTDMRAKLNISADDFVLISVGRNSKVKRMELLFESLKLLKKSTLKFKCICVGPQKDLENLAQKYDIQDIVRTTGTVSNVSDIFNLYRSSNLYISTSWLELFSLTASDALACGIPIVITKKQGIKDLVISGKNGWIIDKDEPDGISSLILSIAKEANKIATNAPNISSTVKHLTWDAAAVEMLKTYKSIV